MWKMSGSYSWDGRRGAGPASASGCPGVAGVGAPSAQGAPVRVLGRRPGSPERPSGGSPAPQKCPHPLYLFPGCSLRSALVPRPSCVSLSFVAGYRYHLLREVFLDHLLQSVLLPSLSPCFLFSVSVLSSEPSCLMATSLKKSVGSGTAATSLCAHGSDPWREQGPAPLAGALVDVCGTKENRGRTSCRDRP